MSQAPQNKGTVSASAEARNGEKPHGVDSQAYQEGREDQQPHAQLQALARQKQEAPAGSPLRQHTPARPVPAGLQLV